MAATPTSDGATRGLAAPTTAASPYELRDYVDLVRRRKLLIGLIALATLAAALGWSLTRPTVYDARALVVIRYVDTPFRSINGITDDLTRAMLTELEAFESDAVRSGVDPALRNVSIDTSVAGQMDLIEVVASDGDAERAAAAANAYASAYAAYRAEQGGEVAVASVSALEGKIGELTDQLADLDAGIAAAEPGTVAYDRAVADAETTASEIRSFQYRLDQLRVDVIAAAPAVEFQSEAAVPEEPVSPKPLRDGAVGVSLGAVLGFAVATLLDSRDRSVRSVARAARALPGIPLVGPIPGRGRTRRRGADAEPGPRLPGLAMVRLALDGTDASVPRLILVTTPDSSRHGAGLAVALAQELASTGKTVVVADLEGSASERWGSGAGVGEVLAGDARLVDVVMATNLPGVTVVPAGHGLRRAGLVPSHPTGQAMLDGLLQLAQVAIAIGGPVLHEPGTLDLAARSSVTLLAVPLPATDEGALATAGSWLLQCGAEPVAVLLRSVTPLPVLLRPVATSEPPLASSRTG